MLIQCVDYTLFVRLIRNCRLHENSCSWHELSLVVTGFACFALGCLRRCSVTDRWSPVFRRNLLRRR